MKSSRKRKSRPVVESLESIAPPTSGLGGVAAPATIVAATSQGPHLTLSGTIHGTYLPAPTIPDIGGRLVLNGSGTLKNLPAFKVTGLLHTTGFIATGHATATLILTNGKGTIDVSLTGPLQHGFSPPPSSFTYLITGGTGKYVGAHGTGSVSYSETTTPSRTSTMKFH